MSAKLPVYDILEDIVRMPDILMIVKSGPAVAEIRSHGLMLRSSKEWITIGENDGPAHMHLKISGVHSIKFVREQKPNRTSYSVRFLNDAGERVLAAFFTKMYDSDMKIIASRRDLFDTLEKKWETDV